jgi:hypothetical protein
MIICSGSNDVFFLRGSLRLSLRLSAVKFSTAYFYRRESQRFTQRTAEALTRCI